MCFHKNEFMGRSQETFHKKEVKKKQGKKKVKYPILTI